MKNALIFFYTLMIALNVCAMETPEDILRVDGKNHVIRADPLWRYLSTSCPFDKLEAYVNNFYEPQWPNVSRYWMVENTFLYLERIEDIGKNIYPLEKLFIEYDGSPVRAIWFSGNISFRLGKSPVIFLNREYYEEEQVIRFVRGREVERFVVNHRERWLSYARNIMDQHRPLSGFSPDIPEASSDRNDLMTGFLRSAFSVVTNPEKKPSTYCPVIWIEFQIDLEDFEITEAHKVMSSYELLEAIADEMRAEIHVTLEDRLVTYIVRPKGESDAPAMTAEPQDPSS